MDERQPQLTHLVVGGSEGALPHIRCCGRLLCLLGSPGAELVGSTVSRKGAWAVARVLSSLLESTVSARRVT